jgi:hypothetical protein
MHAAAKETSLPRSRAQSSDGWKQVSSGSLVHFNRRKKG